MYASHKRYIVMETTFSVMLNMAISALFVWLMFGGRDAIGLWGADGLAVDLLPTTFMITLMTTIALTLITRRRVRLNQVAALSDGPLPLPRFFLLRGLVLALAATSVLVPLTVLVLHVLDMPPLRYGAVMVFKLAYGGVLAMVVTPLILIAALRDRS